MEYFSPSLRILQTDRYLMVCPFCTIRLIRYVNSLCKILLHEFELLVSAMTGI